MLQAHTCMRGTLIRTILMQRHGCRGRLQGIYIQNNTQVMDFIQVQACINNPMATRRAFTMRKIMRSGCTMGRGCLLTPACQL